MEAGEWLSTEIAKMNEGDISRGEIEDFLVDLDVNYIQHVTFHLKTLKTDVKSALDYIGNSED
jgi:hypothetical protein